MTVFDYTLTMLSRAAEEGFPWSVSPAEAAALVAEVERLRAEVDVERAAVVAWLRGNAGFRMVPGNMAYCDYYADAIERGEHRHEEER